MAFSNVSKLGRQRRGVSWPWVERKRRCVTFGSLGCYWRGITWHIFFSCHKFVNLGLTYGSQSLAVSHTWCHNPKLVGSAGSHFEVGSHSSWFGVSYLTTTFLLKTSQTRSRDSLVSSEALTALNRSFLSIEDSIALCTTRYNFYDTSLGVPDISLQFLWCPSFLNLRQTSRVGLIPKTAALSSINCWFFIAIEPSFFRGTYSRGKGIGENSDSPKG